MIPITLTDKEAQMFVLFMKHYDKIVPLIESGFYEFSNGNMTIHFDHQGVIQKVETNCITYKHQKLDKAKTKEYTITTN